MSNTNTNYPWSIVQAGDAIKHRYQNIGINKRRAEDTTIVDADGFEVVGCSEWMRGDENFERIILCVNACANFTDEQLKNNKLKLEE